VKSIGAREGNIDGMTDGMNRNMRGSRGSFMRRRDLAEGDWPAYRDAYNAAVRTVSLGASS
jgi:hypothetical protein